MADLETLIRGSRLAEKGHGPLYVNLARLLSDLIAKRVLEPGAALPTERDLAQMCGLSRVTVRKAVEDLVRAGKLIRKQGSGTFVAPQAKVEQALSKLTSFTEDMARRGIDTRSVWLRKAVSAPSPDEIMVLGLGHEDSVVRLERLRTGRGEPLAIELATISTRYLPAPELVDGSLYETLRARGHAPVRATQRISARICDEREAHLLGITRGDAVLLIERVAWLRSGQVIELTRSVYRGDKYDFVAELRIPE